MKLEKYEDRRDAGTFLKGLGGKKLEIQRGRELTIEACGIITRL
jgi:hypothetical protein